MKKFRFEYRTTIIYLVIGVLWIVFSDKLLEYLFNDMNTILWYQSIKGIIFVVITSLLIFILIRRYANKQRLIEAKLQESSARYKALYENAPVPFQSLDPDGNFRDINPAWLNLLGYSREEVIGKSFGDFMDPESKSLYKKQFPEFKRSGTVRNVVFMLQKKSGDYIYTLYRGNAAYDADGNFLHTYCTFQDITPEYLARKKLAESEKQHKDLFYKNKLIMLLLDDETGNIIDGNESAIKFYGYSSLELRNLRISDVLVQNKEEVEAEIEKAFSQNRDFLQLQHRLSNGMIRDVQVYSGTIASISNGQLRYMVMHDNTRQILAEQDLLKAKERAEESDRLKSAFLANMSHEIRTPMNGIMGFIYLLQEPDVPPDKSKRFLNYIKESSRRLLDTINDILEISRIESGQISVHKSAFNPDELLDSLFIFFRNEARNKNLELRMTIKQSVNGNLETDKQKLESILINLIRNAIKFTHSGFVEIGYSINNSTISFFVKDSGIGIAADKLVLVFDRFVQVDSTTTKPYEGSGLGLSIARAYAQMIGGYLDVTSQPGEGSTFKLNFPLVEVPVENQGK